MSDRTGLLPVGRVTWPGFLSRAGVVQGLLELREEYLLGGRGGGR